MKPTRNTESRAATARPSIGGEPRRRLDVDLTGLPSDLEATWIRETVFGERDDNNLEAAMQDRGFRPATTNDLPGMKPISIPGRPVSNDDLIRRGGQILMLRPKQAAVAERAYESGLVREQVANAQRIATDAGARIDGQNFTEHADNQISERTERNGTARFAE